MKIDSGISSKVLTISQDYLPPRGGIAQVVYSYDNFVFENFKSLRIKKRKNIWISRLHIIITMLKLTTLLIFDRNIKIVHIHTASYNRFYFNTYYLRIAKLFNKKVIMHIHGGGFAKYYETKPQWIKSMLDKCDVVVALTSFWERFFKEKVGCKNVIQINNIIEEPQYKATTKDNTCKHLLFLGKICNDKGIYDLIEVIKEHRIEFDGKLVLHIGGGGEVDKLNTIIENEALQDIIKYEGWINGDKKISLFNQCDVYVLPSYIEGLPISILEALSYGHYIISTTIGGIPEIIKNKEEGVLFTPGDKEALYNILKEVISNNTLLENKEKRIEISNKHTPKEVAKELLSMYKKLL